MPKDDWKAKSLCLNYDTNIFFDKYEEDLLLRPSIDELCMSCPVSRTCFAVGISQKEWGIWGGVYLENGQISKEFNNHKSKKDWGSIWQSLTISQGIEVGN